MQKRGYYRDIRDLGIVQWLKCFHYEHGDIVLVPETM